MIRAESIFCYHSLGKFPKSCPLSRLRCCLQMLELQKCRVPIQGDLLSDAWQHRLQAAWRDAQRKGKYMFYFSVFLELKRAHWRVILVLVVTGSRSILRFSSSLLINDWTCTFQTWPANWSYLSFLKKMFCWKKFKTVKLFQGQCGSRANKVAFVKASGLFDSVLSLGYCLNGFLHGFFSILTL